MKLVFFRVKRERPYREECYGENLHTYTLNYLEPLVTTEIVRGIALKTYSLWYRDLIEFNL